MGFKAAFVTHEAWLVWQLPRERSSRENLFIGIRADVTEKAGAA